jgi:hypothetical protein
MVPPEDPLEPLVPEEPDCFGSPPWSSPPLPEPEEDEGPESTEPEPDEPSSEPEPGRPGVVSGGVVAAGEAAVVIVAVLDLPSGLWLRGARGQRNRLGGEADVAPRDRVGRQRDGAAATIPVMPRRTVRIRSLVVMRSP